MDRREFIKRLTLVGAGALAAKVGYGREDRGMKQIARRRYGDTGLELSMIGFGGIVVSQVQQREANEFVAWAYDRGINYYDVAPTYGDAQDRLGPALKPYRDQVFLACKTGKRDAVGAREELESSLKVLQTDHFDLYQLHGISQPQEVEVVLGPGGAMETLIKAREEGKIRWIGFSAHHEEAATLLLEQYRFDSVLFPFNANCMESDGFGRQVLATARRRGTARLGLKAIALRPWAEGADRGYPKCWYEPCDDVELAGLLLRYALDLPITATVPPGDMRLLRLAVELAARYEPLAAGERDALLARLAGNSPIFAHPA